MHNASQPQSTLTATINAALFSVNNINAASLTIEQIALLEQVANLALSHAQEAREQIAADEAAFTRMEEDADDECAWESDALDHSCEGGEDRHLDGYWESLTDVGDMGGGDW
jgi:hypothetical protein